MKGDPSSGPRTVRVEQNDGIAGPDVVVVDVHAFSTKGLASPFFGDF
jgi:hypothetical protein